MPKTLSGSDPIRVRFDDFELDEANAWLLRGGKAVALAPTPFTLLCALARRPDALFTKDALLDAVWGHRFVTESVLKTAISDLRTALGDDAREPRFIQTVPRRGYRFIAATTAATVPTHAPTVGAPASSNGSPTFIGRVDALARLRRGWGQACIGQRAVMWVAGEPGIGKSMLIEHFVTGLGSVATSRGQCVEHYGTGESYLPVLEALAELCRKDADLPSLLRAVGPTWLLQLPWLGTAEEREVLRRELAGVGPDRMLREMGELLDRYTDQRPLLLVTEDLHWSDRATIQLIDHVARRRGRASLMWLASFRVAEVVATDHPLSALRRELRLHGLCEEIVLDAFSETDVAAYVVQRAPSLASDDAFVRVLHERTDGVPLFVSSVITEVIERTDDRESAQARLAAVAVPENLAAVIDHYIARLGSDERALLTAAAVCGVEFRIETLALALGLDIASVAQACDQQVREHVWLVPRAREGSDGLEVPYSFKHALFRQVLYDRTAPSARAQVHRKVGAALDAERAAGVAIPASELAMHFDRGRQPMAALRCYAEAAEAALLNFSPAVCLGLTERARTLMPQAPEGAERDALELTVATLQGMSAFQCLGAGGQALTAFEHAYALLVGAPEHLMRSRLLHGLGYVSSLRGDYVKALVIAKRAEALAALSDDQELMLVACFLHGEAHHLQGRTEAAKSWMERGLVIAETRGPARNDVFAADPQVTLLGMLAIDLVRCGLVQQGRALVKRANARAIELRQPMTRLVVAWQGAILEVRLRGVDRVAALADEMQALVDEFGLPHGHTAAQCFRGWAEAHNGRPQEGYLLIRAAYEQNTQLGMRVGASEVLGYAAEALLLAGDAEGAHAQLQEALQIAQELDEGVYLPQLLLLQAAIEHAQKRPEAGSVSVRRAVEAARKQQAPWLELIALVELVAQGGASKAERQALAELVDQLPEAAETEPVVRARSLLRPTKPA